jgi:hypothetical protein
MPGYSGARHGMTNLPVRNGSAKPSTSDSSVGGVKARARGNRNVLQTAAKAPNYLSDAILLLWKQDVSDNRVTETGSVTTPRRAYIATTAYIPILLREPCGSLPGLAPCEPLRRQTDVSLSSRILLRQVRRSGI